MTTSSNMPPVHLDDEFAAVGEELERLDKAARIAARHAADKEFLKIVSQSQPEPPPPTKPKPPPGYKLCKACGRTLLLASFYRHPLTADGRMGKCRQCYAANRKKRSSLGPHA